MSVKVKSISLNSSTSRLESSILELSETRTEKTLLEDIKCSVVPLPRLNALSSRVSRTFYRW